MGLTGLLLLVCIACGTPKTRTLTVRFKDKKYDQLLLSLVTDRDGLHRFHGVSEDGATWLFSIPDSLLVRQRHSTLFTELSDTLVAPLRFLSQYGTDTVRYSQMRIKHGDQFKLEYLRSSYEENSTFYHNRDVRKDEFVATGSMDFETYGQSLTLKLFWEKQTALVLEQIKGHPSSICLMYILYRSRQKFPKEQLQEMYGSFDEAAQQSYWGKKVSELLLMQIPKNVVLRNLENSHQERMIIDTTKYNMVVFSASWCGWCHKQIPLLKQIYSDLHERGLEMAYITVDKEKDLETWNKVMEEYEVPWRSLWGKEKTDLITYKFGVSSYPHTILFYPDGTSEKIDVRKEPEKEKLYRLLNGADALKGR